MSPSRASGAAATFSKLAVIAMRSIAPNRRGESIEDWLKLEVELHMAECTYAMAHLVPMVEDAKRGLPAAAMSSHERARESTPSDPDAIAVPTGVPSTGRHAGGSERSEA